MSLEQEPSATTHLPTNEKVAVQFTPAGMSCVGLGTMRRTPKVSLAASSTLSMTDTVAICTVPAGVHALLDHGKDGDG